MTDDTSIEAPSPKKHALGEDIIVCRGVKKWFGDFQALRGISTTVRER